MCWSWSSAVVVHKIWCTGSWVATVSKRVIDVFWALWFIFLGPLDTKWQSHILSKIMLRVCQEFFRNHNFFDFLAMRYRNAKMVDWQRKRLDKNCGSARTLHEHQCFIYVYQYVWLVFPPKAFSHAFLKKKIDWVKDLIKVSTKATCIDEVLILV